MTPQAATRKKLIKMVARLIKAGMSEERALSEVAFGYHVDLNDLRNIYKGENDA